MNDQCIQDIKQRVSLMGKPLDELKFLWDNHAKTFSSLVDNLVLDFGDLNGITFELGAKCVVVAGDRCTFTGGADNIFNTGHSCVFDAHEGSYVVRRDISEFIELEEGKTIRLNKNDVPGYTYVEKETCTRKKKLKELLSQIANLIDD